VASSSPRAREQLLACVERRIVDDGVEQLLQRAAELRALAIAELQEVAAVDSEILSTSTDGATGISSVTGTVSESAAPPHDAHYSSGNFPGIGDYAFLSDSALDAMIVRARSTPDTAEKARLSREIDARVFDLAPWIFLWFPTDVWAVQPDVKGWRIPAVFTGQRWTGVERTR